MRRYLFVILCMLATLPGLSQQREVKGVVTDAAGEPVIGATIRVNGADRATITDMDGHFSIQASPKEKLKISFVGYHDALITASKNSLNVTLQEDSHLLDDVVVVGYGTQKKATLTGAVASISNKEMTITKNENTVNMLAGKIPGIRITQSSSQPGEFNSKIDIRGMGAPLIVVDGIPRDQSYFSRMDANEIENVSVLKDASAAIYGVRAANGVILVTTKHGTGMKDGKFDITFSANYGWQSFLYLPETASAAEHIMLYNEKINNSLSNNTYPQRLGHGLKSYKDMFYYTSHGITGTNWTKEMFDKTSPQEQYNVSLNGSSQKIDYFFNVGYTKQMGSYKSHSMNYDRWNFRSNVDARITDRLKATVSLSGYKDEKNQPYTDIWSVYKKAWTYRPTASPYLNGNTEYPSKDPDFTDESNPVTEIDSDYSGFRRERRFNFNGAMTLQYDFKYVKGLSAKAFYSYDYYTTDNHNYQKEYSLYRLNDPSLGIDEPGNLVSLPQNSGKSYVRRWTDPSHATDIQLSLNYDGTFGSHKINALLLYEEQYNTWDNFSAQRNMLLSTEYLFAGDTDGMAGSSSGVGDITRKAWVGRLNYDYQGKYLAEFAFREDASSRWADGKRWGFFPSVLVGWRASEEPFVKKLVPFLSNLKFRLSYGEMGDDGAAGTYPPTVIGYNLNNDFGWYYTEGILTTGVTPTAIPNPDLTWYKSKLYNAGLDFELWNGLLGGTFEVFKRNRSGLLDRSNRTIPGTVGADLPLENMNSDITFGWEISLYHRHRIGELGYQVMGQISAAKNRWDKRNNNQGSNSMSNWYDVNRSGRNMDIWFSIEEGGRFGSYEEIQKHTTIGTNYGTGTLPGDYWYKDWNGDGVVDGNDNHPVATFNLPVFNYGLSLSADWRGIDLSMNWQGSAGIYNLYDEVFTEVCPFNGGAALDIYLDRWHTKQLTDDPWNPNTEWVSGYYPATGHSFNIGTTGIQNTSYIRLKTLELGYTLPKKWLGKVGMKDLRVYVNAYNLLTITGIKNMDPERPGHQGGANNGNESGILFYNYPVNRSFNVGATLKF